MADVYDDPAARLNDLLDAEERRIAQIFGISIQDLKDSIDLQEIADLIEAGRQDEAIDQLMYAAEQLGSASNVTFVTSGQSTASFLSDAGVGRIVFDQVNTFAVAAMQATRLDLITEFTAEQRAATNLALVSGIEQGTNPIAIARNFRDSVGLTERQWVAVQNYRRSLESIGTDEEQTIAALTHATRDRRGDQQIRRAVRESRPLPPEKIDWLVQRKIDMSIKQRAEVIGRTEAMRAVNAGNDEMYRQAIANGTLRAETLRRTWVTRLDGRERETHFLLNGEVRRWGEVWQTRNGTLRFPGDPNAPAAEVIQCFPGSARIFAGGLKRVIIRDYRGEMVQLRIAGSVDLAVTPNHPVLTQRGWIPASDAVEGDYLINARLGDGMLGSHPDVQDGYASAESLARLAELSGDIERARPGIVNLHGEMPDHEVKIIAPPSELRDAFEALGRQTFGQLGLVGTDIATGLLLFDRMLGHDLGSLDPIQGGRVGRGREVSSFLATEPGHAQSVSLAARPSLEPQFVEAVADDHSGRPQLTGDAEKAVPSGVQPPHFGMEGSAIFSVRQVLATNSAWHDGPVFNFETDSGLIINDGIVFHNCRCVLATRIAQ